MYPRGGPILAKKVDPLFEQIGGPNHDPKSGSKSDPKKWVKSGPSIGPSTSTSTLHLHAHDGYADLALSV